MIVKKFQMKASAAG